MLVSNRETKVPRQRTRFSLAHIAERKAQQIELFARRCIAEIALIAIRIGGAIKRATTHAISTAGHIMAGCQRRRTQVTRGR